MEKSGKVVDVFTSNPKKAAKLFSKKEKKGYNGAVLELADGDDGLVAMRVAKMTTDKEALKVIGTWAIEHHDVYKKHIKSSEELKQ